ncbi:unnamed protein product [Enterobius vermicularis]|uniref:Secreted protein n=1 Tax=Enterobius vermicularis TaxID=51028 RepID=A0A0N4VN13_ENTVE|nr:unnamed protein product [Enterobius vermicularis]
MLRLLATILPILAVVKFGTARSLANTEYMPDIETVELPVGRFPEPNCRYKIHLVNRYGPMLNRYVS